MVNLSKNSNILCVPSESPKRSYYITLSRLGKDIRIRCVVVYSTDLYAKLQFDTPPKLSNGEYEYIIEGDGEILDKGLAVMNQITNQTNYKQYGKK